MAAVAGYAPLASQCLCEGTLQLGTVGANPISFEPNQISRWKIDATGNLVMQTAGLYVELFLGAAPGSAPAANHAQIFLVNNGGKGNLNVRFPTGATQLIAAEP